MIWRGEIYWADLGDPQGSSPGFRRPVIVVSSDEFNRSRIRTAIVVVLTSNTALAAMPGNVFIPASAAGLTKDSVANITAVATVDKSSLSPTPVGNVPAHLLEELDAGLRLGLGL